jgi:hypothetical protein
VTDERKIENQKSTRANRSQSFMILATLHVSDEELTFREMPRRRFGACSPHGGNSNQRDHCQTICWTGRFQVCECWKHRLVCYRRMTA